MAVKASQPRWTVWWTKGGYELGFCTGKGGVGGYRYIGLHIKGINISMDIPYREPSDEKTLHLLHL